MKILINKWDKIKSTEIKNTFKIDTKLMHGDATLYTDLEHYTENPLEVLVFIECFEALCEDNEYVKLDGDKAIDNIIGLYLDSTEDNEDDIEEGIEKIKEELEDFAGLKTYDLLKHFDFETDATCCDWWAKPCDHDIIWINDDLSTESVYIGLE